MNKQTLTLIKTSGWTEVTKDKVIAHDLESYPLHLRTSSKIGSDNIIIRVNFNVEWQILVLIDLGHEPAVFMNVDTCVDSYIQYDLHNVSTDSRQNFLTLRKTNSSLEIDLNGKTEVQHILVKHHEVENCVELQSMNIFGVIFESETASSWFPNNADDLQYRPHVRGNSNILEQH